jgi:hypothetical protein
MHDLQIKYFPYDFKFNEDKKMQERRYTCITSNYIYFFFLLDKKNIFTKKPI